MIDYSEEVARIEDERCGNQWRRAEDYASLASRLREERDACAAGAWRGDVKNIPQRGRILIRTANGHVASVWYDFAETSFVDGHFCYDVPDIVAWAEIRQHTETPEKTQ